MLRRTLVAALLPAMVLVGAAFRAPSAKKSPPWLSIESPVNPYDPAVRGAVLLVHASLREGSTQLTDVSGSAEGLVNGSRRSVPLQFAETGRPNVYALRPQWSSDGAWVLRISLRTATAIVTLDHGAVASVRVPTEMSYGIPVPRAVSASEVDSSLAAITRR